MGGATELAAGGVLVSAEAEAPLDAEGLADGAGDDATLGNALWTSACRGLPASQPSRHAIPTPTAAASFNAAAVIARATRTVALAKKGVPR